MVVRIFISIFRILEMIARITMVVLFWFIVIALFLLFTETRTRNISGKNLLVIKPSGILVDDVPSPRYFDWLPQNNSHLSDLIRVLDHARMDENIAGVHLDLNDFYWWSPCIG